MDTADSVTVAVPLFFVFFFAPRFGSAIAITGAGNGKGMASLAVWAMRARSHTQVPSLGRVE